MTRTEISKKPDNEKTTVYAGGEVRTITYRQLKKNMGIPDRSKGWIAMTKKGSSKGKGSKGSKGGKKGCK